MVAGDFFQLGTGQWINVVDGTGPYIRTASGTYELASTSNVAAQAAQLAAIDATNAALAGVDASVDAVNSSVGTTNAEIGALNETAPANDTAPSGINGRLQRLAQRLTDTLTVVQTLADAKNEFLIRVGFGDVAGYSRVTALGNNPDIDTGTAPEDVWTGGGTYPWMTGATSLEVLSSSASDTVAGTGARTIRIDGLTTAFTPISQTITLNGTTPVAVPTQLYRINGILVLTAGSTQSNVGVITVRDAGGGTTRGQIDVSTTGAGIGISRQSIYTVPAGFTLQIIDQAFSINKATGTSWATLCTWIRSASGVARMPLLISVSSNQPYAQPGMPGIVLSEKTDFCYRCIEVSANNTNVTAGFLGVLRQNGVT